MASVDCTPESSGAFRQMAMPIDPRAMILSLANHRSSNSRID
jgi:hypothetical protein